VKAIAGYLLTNRRYTFLLKHEQMVDFFTIAPGFVLAHVAILQRSITPNMLTKSILSGHSSVAVVAIQQPPRPAFPMDS
jgi:hypothetical protein